MPFQVICVIQDFVEVWVKDHCMCILTLSDMKTVVFWSKHSLDISLSVYKILFWDGHGLETTIRFHDRY